MMEQTQRKAIIENVAAGLRKMKTQPDYFLFLQEPASGNWTWDEDEICGIPVLHSGYWIKQTGTDYEMLFHPLWKEEGDYDGLISDFQHGCED